jgi:hypothetical protein
LKLYAKETEIALVALCDQLLLRQREVSRIFDLSYAITYIMNERRVRI